MLAKQTNKLIKSRLEKEPVKKPIKTCGIKYRLKCFAFGVNCFADLFALADRINGYEFRVHNLINSHAPKKELLSNRINLK